MMTSGLVVRLNSDSPEAALAAIHTAPSLTVGEQYGDWLTVVVETPDAVESERLFVWLQDLPGVESVEVVFVHWDEVEVTHAVA